MRIPNVSVARSHVCDHRFTRRLETRVFKTRRSIVFGILATLERMAVLSRRAGPILVALSYALSGMAAYAILGTRPDVATRTGRHLMAGALAIITLSGVEILIAFVPLRRGERWAFWAALLPLISLVLPIMFLDATHVAFGNLLITLAPFVAGLVLAISGLVLTRSHRETE